MCHIVTPFTEGLSQNVGASLYYPPDIDNLPYFLIRLHHHDERITKGFRPEGMPLFFIAKFSIDILLLI